MLFFVENIKMEELAFLQTLENRFNKNKHRFNAIEWKEVLEKLLNNPLKINSLKMMEETGGEPALVSIQDGKYQFFDCSVESPSGRRSLCYDREALDSRKENKPENSAIDVANEMNVSILTEDQYRFLQTLGNFDLKTSSWILTPPEIRTLGGALFCDRRYNFVFTYHNGAQSYYAARGFRACLEL